jgi:hypothetical protein
LNAEQLRVRFTELCNDELPLPGQGRTAERYLRIFEAGREDLSLAKLIEAHWDAVAILWEAGLPVTPGAGYAVWASERPGASLSLTGSSLGYEVSGRKEFCSGSDLVDRALVSVEGDRLVELDLHASPERLVMDGSAWQVDAFRMTHTAAITFDRHPVASMVGETKWYVERTGFWQGAIGPAAAWAGGASTLVDVAMASKRSDPHTSAHLGVMEAQVWSMKSLLRAAGDEFDNTPRANAMVRALMVRHLIEQSCTDVLRRFARAMGPAPLAMNADIARRYAELDIYLRQSHAERDLEALGKALRNE